MSAVEKKAETVEALARGLAVIECFDEDHAEMTLTEVAVRAGVTPATARRILRTLEMQGYVGMRQKRFFLRPRVLRLGSAFLRSAQIDSALMPELRRIVERFGDAASVGVLTSRDVFYVGHLSDQKAMRPVASLGISYPAHATSMGQVLLAGLAPATLDAFFKQGPLAAMTSETITEPAALRERLATVWKDGYAVVRDQLAYGVTALAVPVVLGSEGVVAAVNSSGYSGHVTPEKLVAERLDELRLSARRIADLLVRYPTLRHAVVGSGKE